MCVRQWEGWHPIIPLFMIENNPNVWNHQPDEAVKSWKKTPQHRRKAKITGITRLDPSHLWFLRSLQILKKWKNEIKFQKSCDLSFWALLELAVSIFLEQYWSWVIGVPVIQFVTRWHKRQNHNNRRRSGSGQAHFCPLPGLVNSQKAMERSTHF